MKKVLIIGCNGMAGHLIFNYFKSLNKFNVFGIARNIESSDSVFNLDVNDLNTLEQIIVENRFDYIINCVAVLNRDAEDNPEKAIWYNSFFPYFLESITKKTNIKCIFISSDCVFSGAKGNYLENDFKDGTGFYAQSKGLGEVVNKKDVTIRTSIIGPELNNKGIGLLNWFLSQPNDVILKGHTKSFWTGLTTLELAKAINQIINQNIVGLVHIIPNKKTTKFNLISFFNQVFKDNKINIIEDDDFKSDRSLQTIRSDFDYSAPNYLEMTKELKNWMEINRKLYSHYSF